MLPWWSSGEESTCQCRRLERHVFNPWVEKIPWRGKWQPTPVFLPEKSNGQMSLECYTVHGVTRVRHNLATKQHQQTTTKLLKITRKSKWSERKKKKVKQFKLFFLALKVTGPSLFVSSLLFKHKLVYHHKGWKYELCPKGIQKN